MSNNLASVVAQHGARYPQMLPQDVFKLLYQSQFGPGHLIENPAQTLDYLEAEWANCPADAGQPLLENIGNGFSRLYLSAAKAQGIALPLIHRLFCASAQPTGTAEGFIQQVKLLMTACDRGELPFMSQDLAGLLMQWEREGRPHFSHTAQYRDAYHPAYRVVRSAYGPVLPLLQAIERGSREAPMVVAIDGRCGAGKTTLAALLAEVFLAPVIHMDDFFLPPALRTEERLGQPGGNIHAERFEAEVLAKLKTDQPFSYRVFDCSIGDYGDTRHIVPSPVTIIEGVYSMHPQFRSGYDLTVFCQIDQKTQKARITARNGEAGYGMFASRWIPLEERYFTVFHVEQSCQVCIAAPVAASQQQ